MRSIPLVGWYVAGIREAAQPRDPLAVNEELPWLKRLLFRKPRYGEGYGTTTWAGYALLYAFCIVALAVAGAWWLSLLWLPIEAWVIARMIGTYREGYWRW